MVIDKLNQGRVMGGYLGSSYKLMEELIWIAPKLGIYLEGDFLPDAELAKLHNDPQEGFWIERLVWLSLYEAARLSIKHKMAICFT